MGSSRNRTSGRWSSDACDLDLHPFAEAQVPDGLPDELAQLEQLHQLVDALLEVRAWDAVDRPVQLERVDDRDVPLQLVALTHDQRHPAEERVVALPRCEAEGVRLAARRMEQPRQHLERRGLAGAVRPEEADDLARLDLERDAGHGFDRLRLPAEEAARGRADTALALGHEVGLAQVVDTDRRRASRVGQRAPRRLGRESVSRRRGRRGVMFWPGCRPGIRGPAGPPAARIGG